MPQPLRDIWQWILDQPDQVQAVLALLTFLGAGIGTIIAFFKWVYPRLRRKRPTGATSNIQVITDPQALMTSLYGAPRGDDPLADQNIPYQQRTPGRDTQGELRTALRDHRCLLITGRSGLGKTREAAVLASSLMNEGWRVVRVTPGWLEPLAGLPEGLNADRRHVLILLDDLNGLFQVAGEVPSPAKDDPGRLPSYRDRLRAFLDGLDKMCGEGEVRILATARDEPEAWAKLEHNPADPLWRRFALFSLSPPVDAAVEGVLDEATENAKLPAERGDFPAIADANDGTFANVVLNLRRARGENRKVARDGYIETLAGSWREVYERAVNEEPAVAFVYEAMWMLRDAGIELHPWLVIPATGIIRGGNALHRLIRRRQAGRAITYLTEKRRILAVDAAGRLAPRDGQIEACGRSVDWRPHTEALVRLLLDAADRHGAALLSSLVGFVAILHDTGKGESGLPLAQQCVNLQPDVAVWHSNLGVLLAGQPGRQAEAEAAYREAIRLDPADAAAHYNLGVLLAGQPGRQAEAVAAYREAIRLDPADAAAHNNLGNLLAKQPGRGAEAEAAYREAIRLDPADAAAHYNLGVLLAGQPGRGAEAEAAYREAIRLDPALAVAHYNLGVLLRQLGRLDEALAATLKSHELQPRSISLVGLAGIYRQMGDDANARRYAAEARALAGPDDAYNLACIEAITGDADAALAQLQRTKELGKLNAAWAWKDPDLEALRDDPRFREIVGPPPAE